MLTGDQLVSWFQAQGVVEVPFDLFDIDRRIKEGDESGWRGDPTMGVFINPHTQPPQFEVWGVDRAGRPYMACSHHELSPVIIQKLVAGDPSRRDVVAEVMAHNAKVMSDQRRAKHERAVELADKLAFGIRKDFGHLDGGTRRVHGYTPEKAGV